MQNVNLFTLPTAPAAEHAEYRDINATDFPPGTTLQDSDGDSAVIVLHNGKPAIMSDLDDDDMVAGGVWHDARPVNADGSPFTPPITEGQENTKCEWLDYTDRVGQVFVDDEGQRHMSVYGLNVYDDEQQRVYLVGIDDPTAKTYTAKRQGRWLTR